MAFIILPNQLFKLKKDISAMNIYIIEHPLYFSKYNYHKLKLILHRASMKKYVEKLNCVYIDHGVNYEYIFKENKIVTLYDPVDHDISKEFKNMAKRYGCELIFLESPNFICSLEDLKEYHGTNKLVHKTFYIYFRKKYNILIDQNSKKGIWSFDKENRLMFPKDFADVYEPKTNNSDYIEKATKYVKANFPKHFGETDFYLPIDHDGARKHFDEFIKDRLDCFGKYQDAASDKITFGCHSVMSPLLNIGLLDPIYVIDKIIESGSNMASIEGFVRQIFWREYVRFVYMFEYKQLNKNYFDHHNKLSKSWYTGDTGMPNIDYCIKKLYKYGYLHHIERLMHVGNFMLLTEINPEEVYKWFMMCIDAYPWVMAPNVYGMSQYSSGKLMMTRPYFSSSNYIKNMSNFRDNKAFDIWNALYYNFVDNNKKTFALNYSTANSVKLWLKKSSSEKADIKKISKKYLAYLDRA